MTKNQDNETLISKGKIIAISAVTFALLIAIAVLGLQSTKHNTKPQTDPNQPISFEKQSENQPKNTENAAKPAQNAPEQTSTLPSTGPADTTAIGLFAAILTFLIVSALMQSPVPELSDLPQHNDES